MADFELIPIKPYPALAPYIEKMWVLEFHSRLSLMEKKLIVPNANFKLAFIYRNGMVNQIGEKNFPHNENELKIAGLIDTPVFFKFCEETGMGSIVIEFSPLGAYRFFRLSYAELKNQIIDLTDLIGLRAKNLQVRLAEAGPVSLKSQILQDFLLRQLETIENDPIYDYCIDRILNSGGLVTVVQLEKETGYSSRWLHNKFSENLGTGPKNLSEIIRFKQFYQVYSANPQLKGLKDQIYRHYYDQSHFIRVFKRFTGTTPSDLEKSLNEFSTKYFTS
jgi:AraC-like DNA-binding protein